MGRHFCWKCERLHNTPVGKNCSRKTPTINVPAREISPADTQPFDEDSDMAVPPGSTIPTDVQLQDSDIEIQVSAKENATIEARMSRLETMLANLTENLIGNEKPRSASSKHRSSSRSSVSSCPEESRRHKHRHRSPSKSPSNPLGYDSIFPDEDFKVANFEGVMLALFKSLEMFIDENHDINGLVRHGRFMAEKAVADVYVPETFVNFDRHIRSMASKKGYASFDEVSELDKARFFNLENYKEVRALKTKGKQGKKSNGTCRRFNSDQGCYVKSCPYVHRCQFCEVYGHAVKDCRAAMAEKAKK